MDDDGQPLTPTPPTLNTRQVFLAEYLAVHESPCPRCGYNLHGLRSDRCPECGDQIELRIGLTEPRLGAMITLLVFVSLAFGASTLMGLIAAIQAPASWWEETGARCLLAQWIISSIALPTSLLLRQPFRRLPHSSQWIIAILTAVVFMTLSTFIVVLFDS